MSRFAGSHDKQSGKNKKGGSMEIGLLWFDDSKKKSLAEKIDEAVEVYCAKPRFAGKTPNTCYVHPSMLPEDREVRVNGLAVIASGIVAPHHFFIGVEKDDNGRRDRSKRKRRRPRRSKS
jgi:hypothetical protein